MDNYYNIPFSFEALLRQERKGLSCSVQESIIQNISLIISTKLNEFRYDLAYGCKIWEVDFVVPSNINIWKDEIKASLEEAILNYEHRIENVEEFNIKVNADPQNARRNNQILDFEIRGSIKGTSKRFQYKDTLFFSPYSR